MQEATFSKPTIQGDIRITFDHEMIYPSNILEWTSQNGGDDYFDLSYEPSLQS